MGKLIFLPLTCLIVISLFSALGLGSTVFGTGSIDLNTADAMYYDSSGHALMYVGNLSCVGEKGYTEPLTVPDGDILGLSDDVVLAAYANTTGLFHQQYFMFYDDSGSNTKLVRFEDLGKTNDVGSQMTVDISTSLGMIVLIVGLMALAVVVGIKVLGSGTTNSMVVVLGTAYLAIWGVFSVLAFPLIIALALIGPILYLVLTVIFTLGIIASFGGNNGADD